MKTVVALVFSVVVMFASEVDFLTLSKEIDALQKEYLQRVIHNQYINKRYKTYLNDICKEEKNCISERTKAIQTWINPYEKKRMDKAIKQKVLRLNLDYKAFLENKVVFNEKYWLHMQADIFMRLKKKGIEPEESFYFVYIDLINQSATTLFYFAKTKVLFPIGSDLISSGNKNREVEVKTGEDHFFNTPAGVFEVIGGWRSDGKIQDDSVKAYGDKDRFVFYLGKQSGVRYNSFDRNGTKLDSIKEYKLIRDDLQLAMHAHNSKYNFGYPMSHGCLRTSNELNEFLDEKLILHQNRVRFDEVAKKWKWLNRVIPAPKKVEAVRFPGKYIIIGGIKGS